MDPDEHARIASDVPHLLHAWRQARTAATNARRVADLTATAARHAGVAAEAAQSASLAAEEALQMAGVDVSRELVAQPDEARP